MTSEDRECLAAPFGETLFFAGAATSIDYSGTVHGAYLRGLREAKRLLEECAPGSRTVAEPPPSH